MIAMRDKIDQQRVELIKSNIHAGMIAIIETKNAEFVEEQMAEEEIKQFDLFIWIKEKFNGLVRSSK